MKVKNLHGTSGRVPDGYSSWLAFWEANAGQKASECHRFYCNNKDLLGAHVIKADSSDKSWYIIPLCQSCNKRTDEFWVDGKLVKVNQ